MITSQWYYIEQLELPLNYSDSELKKCICSQTGIDCGSIEGVIVEKVSIDARKRPKKLVNCRFLSEAKIDDLKLWEPPEILKFTDVSSLRPHHGIAVIGAGPAGLSAAWWLAKCGLKPEIFDMGDEAGKRSKNRSEFNKTGKFSVTGSLLWGEGGAGTFSDGKLTTRRNDPVFWNTFKKMLTDGGVKQEVFAKAHPHLGTDVLLSILPAIRSQMEREGAVFRWNRRLEDVKITTEGVRCIFNDGEELFSTVILAPGGNNVSVPLILERANVKIHSRSLQIGVRMEQRAQDVNRARYGRWHKEHGLWTAEYNFSDNQSGIRTFCMCPGGEVVCSSGYEGLLSVNGMSYSQRNGQYSNSALITSIDGFSWKESLAIIEKTEKNCFEAGGGNYGAPYQKISDFLNFKISSETQSSYRRGLKPSDLRKILHPDYVKRLESMLGRLPRYLRDVDDGLLIAPESRVTPPWKYERNADGTVLPGVYVVGEGSGYSSGITTSALDGLKIAVGLVNSLGNK